MSAILVLAIVGFCVSTYAFYAHKRVDADDTYQAVCDLSHRISCTRTFESEYGKFLGIPIGFYGMGFYAVIALLNVYGSADYVLYLCVAAVIISGALAYILYFKIKNICLICNSIYVINILLLILSILQIY